MNDEGRVCFSAGMGCIISRDRLIANLPISPSSNLAESSPPISTVFHCETSATRSVFHLETVLRPYLPPFHFSIFCSLEELVEENRDAH